MANSPRPGVIQLDHPNVYMAAKEAQKDDWLRRGINLTGDIAGEALQKRNQDIRYRRAAGLDEDRRTNGEIAADLGSGVWGGLKAVGSGLASVGEGAWGLLKAPFTEDVVTEKSYEEGVKTERPLFQGEMSQEDPFSGGMSREKTMSRAEPEPDDAVSVSFPTTIIGKDRVVEPSRREVGGKFDWDFPNKGYKTEFPTTVVGAPSTLKAPSAQPVSQKAPETPQNDAGATNDKVPEGMLQSPDWSEMYRLDPERAKYDWTRKQQQEELDIKATPKLSPDSSLDDIRATHNTYLNYLATLEQKGVNTDDPRYITAKKNLDYAAGLLAERGLLPKPTEGGAEETPEQKAARLAIGQRALTEGRQAIALAVDSKDPNGKDKPDGLIDNEGEIDKALNDILLNTGVNKNSNEWKIIENEWASTKQRVKTVATVARQLKEYAQADADRARNINIKGLEAYNSNPDVTAYKASRDALAFYNASNKDITAKRKMVYDFIKSYNTGTVLDSELASTLGATTDQLTNIFNMVKQAFELPPSISDAQADAIAKTLENQMTVLKKNADKAYSDIKKTYGTAPPKIDAGDNTKPKKKKDESMAAYMQRLDAWKAKGGK